MLRFVIFLIFFFGSGSSFALKFKGIIVDEKNEPLAFASIFVKNTIIGTNSNEKGEFSLNLEPGSYQVVFRFLGYQTQIKDVEIKDKDLILNILMKPEMIQLAEAKVGKIKEDPALSIMRKTIAMSVFHYNELQSYSFKTYVKGNLKILDIPFVFEKLAQKNFISKNQLYVFESIHQLNFNQPSKLTEKVIAKKDNLPPNLKGSVSISMGKYEIYSPDNQTSPVTKTGARNYRYEYLGYFEENGLIINKIKVTPKVKGYYSGIMNIIDGSWYIHSYDFTEDENDIRNQTKAIFSNIENVWFLSNLNITSNYKNLGIDIEMRAITANKEIRIKKNPKYASVKPEIIDEKLFKEKAELKPKGSPVQKEATLKDLNNLAKKLNKEDQKDRVKRGDADLNRTYNIDSLAEKKDSVFWISERQVPLTFGEIQGFKQADSLYKINYEAINKKVKKDSLKIVKRNTLKFHHLLIGHNFGYDLVKDSTRSYYTRQYIVGNILEDLRFNAVEGYAIGINRLEFIKRNSEVQYLKIGIKSYYSINRNRLNGELYTQYSMTNNQVGFSIGRRVLQIDPQNPVSVLINSAFALFNNQHVARFYEKRFIDLNWHHRFNSQMKMNTVFSLQSRIMPKNIVHKGWAPGLFDSDNVIIHTSGQVFTPGNQTNRLLVQNKFDYSPQARYSIYNGRKSSLNLNEPRFTLSNTVSISTIDIFGLVDFEIEHKIKVGQGSLIGKLDAGFFYGSKPESIIDFKHFMANELWVTTHTGFRALPYYLYSSDKTFLQGFLNWKPKKLVLSQIPGLNKNGLKEYTYFNLLKNPYISYQEAGYGVSIFGGALSGEVFWSFKNKQFKQSGFRLVALLNKNN